MNDTNNMNDEVNKAIDYFASMVKGNKWVACCLVLVFSWVVHRKVQHKKIIPSI